MITQEDIDAIRLGPEREPLAHLDFFEMTSANCASREAMLAVFRSNLGEELQDRDPNDVELGILRETVGQMLDLAVKTGMGAPEDFLIDLASGHEEDWRTIPPNRRTVFNFAIESWQDESPSRVTVS